MTPEETAIREAWEAVADLASRLLRQEAADVEQAILEGENHIETRDPVGRVVLHIVPAWTGQPLRRCRVAWARWRYRRRG